MYVFPTMSLGIEGVDSLLGLVHLVPKFDQTQ